MRNFRQLWELAVELVVEAEGVELRRGPRGKAQDMDAQVIVTRAARAAGCPGILCRMMIPQFQQRWDIFTSVYVQWRNQGQGHTC